MTSQIEDPSLFVQQVDPDTIRSENLTDPISSSIKHLIKIQAATDCCGDVINAGEPYILGLTRHKAPFIKLSKPFTKHSNSENAKTACSTTEAVPV